MNQRSPFVNDSISICFDSQHTPKSTQRREKEQRTLKDADTRRPKPAPEGPKTLAGWRYRIKRDLVKKLGRKYNNLYMCPGCLERKKLTLYRVNKNHNPPGESDYILLCEPCIKKRQQEQKKTKLWSRKPGPRGGSPESAKLNFFLRIRPLVFARDGRECPYCGSKENLGLGALIPLSRGGELSYDNYTVICQKCRAAKNGNQHRKAMTPLEFFWQREGFKYFLFESLDHAVTATPGATARLNVHFIGEIAEFCARVTVDQRVPPEHRKKAEFIHIRLSESEEDKRRQRKAEVGSWIG